MEIVSNELKEIKCELQSLTFDCRENRNENEWLRREIRSLKRFEELERNEEALYHGEKSHEEKQKRRKVETDIKERVRLEELEREKIHYML